MNKLKALIISTNENLITHLKGLCEKHSIDVESISEWKKSFSDTSTYSYYFIDEETVTDDQNISVHSLSYLIGIVQNPSFEMVRSWMNKGANDVVVLPEDRNRLDEFIQNTKETAQARETNYTNAGKIGGKVSAFYSAKGGSGKTFLAAAIAQALQVRHDQKVIVIDLNAQFGGLESMLGLEVSRSYADLQPVVKELGIHHIENVAFKDERTGNLVMLSPANPAKAEDITEELISKLIRICRQSFDHIILDLPSSINTVSFTGLNEAAHIYYVLTPDSPGLKAYKTAEDVFQRFQLGNKENLSVIINRAHAKNELTEKDLAEVVPRPIIGKVRADFFNIQPNINMGTPFYLKKKEKPGSKALKDIVQLVEKSMK
ncbi:AAA family ATPase [Fictibacillus sp. b24]|uniref:AAA family ATPase n=1 Tax=Fictibacillus sp. b24 TaxID=3055863 RepID=UPI0025A17012|nr:AAA family ATPase [Fictibacillus sp. b24]MDM5318222.1 AAA family ATPase [Fictibacillus sp. b24]